MCVSVNQFGVMGECIPVSNPDIISLDYGPCFFVTQLRTSITQMSGEMKSSSSGLENTFLQIIGKSHTFMYLLFCVYAPGFSLRNGSGVVW